MPTRATREGEAGVEAVVLHGGLAAGALEREQVDDLFGELIDRTLTLMLASLLYRLPCALLLLSSQTLLMFSTHAFLSLTCLNYPAAIYILLK